MVPQLPVSAELPDPLLDEVAELDELAELVELVELEELEEHAVAAASSITLPTPSVNLTIPRLIKVSL